MVRRLDGVIVKCELEKPCKIWYWFLHSPIIWDLSNSQNISLTFGNPYTKPLNNFVVLLLKNVPTNVDVIV